MAKIKLTTLQTRTLSAFILAPAVLVVIWFGWWPFVCLLLLAALIAVYEWIKLSLKCENWILYLIFGLLYMCISFSCFYLLREVHPAYIFYLLGIVWMSDIGAYFSGKLIGGPKLWESVSPNKTWAGLGGAIFAPLFILPLWLYFDGSREPLFIILYFAMGFMILGVLGQAGDLLISGFKRKAGVKDTGHLIPGHGGLLDRIDSLMLVTPVFYLLLMAYLISKGYAV